MKTILTLCAVAICGAFTLQAADGDKPKKPGTGDGNKPKMNPEEMFKKMDSNGDGSISKDEFMAGPRAKQDPAKAGERFTAIDKNADGKITPEEMKAAGAAKKGDAPKKAADAK